MTRLLSSGTGTVEFDVARPVTSIVGYLAHWAASIGGETALTFIDYSADNDGRASSLTWNELDRRVSATSAVLRRVTRPGSRVAILAPQGPAYVVAFLGALRAGMIAVPLYVPSVLGGTDRLDSALVDCEPACIATTSLAAESIRSVVRTQRPGPPLDLVLIDEIDPGLADTFTPGPVDPTAVAYLQYTSGSTRSPTGVMLTHTNLVANVRQAMAAHEARRGRNTAVSWLPLHHDMGLVLSVAAPVVCGVESVLLDPLAFVQRPARWLQIASRYPGVITAAPNFAYEFCAARIREADKSSISLDSVTSFISGAEPVQAATIARFQAAFSGCGLRPSAQRPSYGLAEATVFVCVSRAGAPPRTTIFDAAGLERGVAIPPVARGSRTVELVSTGNPVAQRLQIVDPATHSRCGAGVVGEIWLQGPNIGVGYWGREPSDDVDFNAAITGDGDEQPVDGSWLRTGDLGVWFEGEVYITGRLKDLIVIDGRNIYPQDIEKCAAEAHPAISQNRLAAFSVPVPSGEGLVVVAERRRSTEAAAEDEVSIVRAIRAAVLVEYGLRVQNVVLVESGMIPRTSSGKTARSISRRAYLDGRLSLAEGVR